MNVEPAPTVAQPLRIRLTRADRPAGTPSWFSERIVIRVAVVMLALGFVVLGAEGLDVGPGEARLALAARESAGPLGQVYGYWAPDIWPGELFPAMLFSWMSPGSQANGAIIRWPSALAAILGGYLLARGMQRALGYRAAISAAIAWFSSLAVMDRSTGAGLDVILGQTGAGLDMVLGVLTFAAIDRVLDRGCDRVAGFWASLAFLAGGWPPLVLIGLTIIVIGRPGSRPGPGLIVPPLLTVVAWSIPTIRLASTEVWASALTMPLTRGIDGLLVPRVLLLGLPWIPFALIAGSRRVREDWPPRGREWVGGWFQAALASMIAGTVVPGLGPAGRVVALAGLLVAAAAGIDLAWRRSLSDGTRRVFFTAFSVLLTAWLAAMIVGCFTWIVTMPYYRPLGICLAVVVLTGAILGWSALESANTRRGLVTLVLLAAGLKLAHWGYYAPEWNYRLSQGPWGRAIGQWVPRKWPIYTFDPWPDDLAFYIGRTVRRLPSPRFLNYLPGKECRFVLIRASDYDNWPDNSPPISVVARFLDASGEERILARTPGVFPVPTTPSKGEASAVTHLDPLPAALLFEDGDSPG